MAEFLVSKVSHTSTFFVYASECGWCTWFLHLVLFLNTVSKYSSSLCFLPPFSTLFLALAWTITSKSHQYLRSILLTKNGFWINRVQVIWNKSDNLKTRTHKTKYNNKKTTHTYKKCTREPTSPCSDCNVSYGNPFKSGTGERSQLWEATLQPPSSSQTSCQAPQRKPSTPHS